MDSGPTRTPEEVAVSRRALAQGDARHAAHHLAGALAADPHHPAALALLGEAIASSPDPLELAPLGPGTFYGTAALRAYVLARLGRTPEAVDLLLRAVRARPQPAYLDWAVDWLRRPPPGGLDLVAVNAFLGWALGSAPGLVVEEDPGRALLTRLLAFVRAVGAGQPTDEAFDLAHTAVLRKLGRLDEALALATRARQRHPGARSARALALVHEARGDWDRWYDAQRDAVAFDPDDVCARLDLADTLWQVLGRPDEAEHRYREVLRRRPAHPWAYPALLALRHQRDRDRSCKDELEHYVHAHPDNEPARDLLLRTEPFFAYLPEPADPAFNGLRRLADAGRGPARRPGRAARLTLDYLGSPSARLAVQLHLAGLGRDPEVAYRVKRIQEPDPRRPRGPVGYLLWKYRGTTPVPAVREPSPAVALAVGELAGRPYDLCEWSAWARAVMAGRPGIPAEDLLGAMVHPPPPLGGVAAWVWLQRVQVASALHLAHLDPGRQGSPGREALVSLARGPLDWTVTAAVLALTALALEDTEVADDVRALFREMLHALPREGPVPHARALLCCHLRLPGLADDEHDALLRWRRRLEGEEG
jgi:tetratricopeptide (TPR) repeat protein